MDLLNIYGAILRDPGAILKEIQEGELALHSSSTEDRLRGKLSFGVAKLEETEVENGGERLKLAAAQVKSEESLLKKYSDAGSAKRGELRMRAELELRSIIYKYYRPGPAFPAGYALKKSDLSAKIAHGEESWWDYLSGKAIDVWAKHALSLENDTGLRGSGTYMENGHILTAKHVIRRPGYLYGSNPSQSSRAKADLNRVDGGEMRSVLVSGFSEPSSDDYAWVKMTEPLSLAFSGTPLAQTPGLTWQTDSLTATELRGKKVAVIGHPLVPRPEEIEAAEFVYGDQLSQGLKRCMPGLLHDETPLIESENLEFLRHDCSTVSGASGALLVDLETGVILGVHVSGKFPDGSEDRNRAVPAWHIELPDWPENAPLINHD